MTALAWLIPIALFLGGLGLVAFLWALKSGQYDDLEGASWRALEDDRSARSMREQGPMAPKGSATHAAASKMRTRLRRPL